MWKKLVWKKKKTKEEKREEKEANLLKELCGNDAKMYALLGHSLYLDPKAAISKIDLNILIEEAEKNVGDENYQEAMQKYTTALDTTIFEASQGEMGRYIKAIQDLASKTARVTEKVKEKREKEGFESRAHILEERVKRYELMSERTEDAIRIASLYYNEKLEELGAIEERKARREKRIEAEREEKKGEKEAKERREEKRRKEMGRRETKEVEREEKAEEKKEKERGEARRKERIEAEREEKRIEEREKET